jgi:RNA polymerase sigma-70 factor (ECF subfamily)
MVNSPLHIQAARQGDINAFNALVEAHQDYVYSVAYRILQDSQWTDDVVQETFWTAFRKLEQFQGENFKAWLGRIAINTCYDELRRKKRHPAEALDETLEGELRLVSPSESPEDYAQRMEARSAIEDCLAQLSPEFRAVVMASLVDEYSYEEIAQHLHLSLGTVKSRLSRARLRLRDCLQAKGELWGITQRLQTIGESDPLE